MANRLTRLMPFVLLPLVAATLPAAEIFYPVTSSSFDANLNINGGTITSNDPLVDATQTWNGAGVTFTGFKVNCTDNASAVASKVCDFQVDGGSKFNVTKAGAGTLAGGLTVGGDLATSAGADRLIVAERTGTSDAARLMFKSAATEQWAFGLRSDAGGSGVFQTLTLTGNAADSYPAILNVVPGGANYAVYWFGGTTANAPQWSNANGAAVFNEQGNAQNFRVESDTQANMLFVDGTNNRVGIGTGSPGVPLQVAGAATIDGNLIWTTTNTYDIGGATTNQPRTLYAGTSVQVISNTGYLGIGTSSPDCFLYRDAGNVFAQRNGTTAQGWRLYNTDNGANDEYLQTQWTSSVLYVGPTLTGSGTQRTLALNAGAQKSLTESSATNFVQIAVASNTMVGGVIHYTLVANDATDYQCRAGSVAFSAVNKAGTETGAVGTPDETVAVSAGTLTNTFTVDTTPTNAVNIQANAVSSLTQTTLAIRYWIEITGPSVTVTPQ